MDTPYQFHAGELLVQERSGVAERMAEIGPRVIRRFMPEQHREFFSQLRYVIVGALDSAGQPWAGILSGEAGFVGSPDATHLHIAAPTAPHDPVHGCLTLNAPLALLGLEAHTRRRNRANGRIVGGDARAFYMQVLESFGNCPKYIQARAAVVMERAAEAAPEITFGLTADMQRLIVSADTFFLASAHRLHGVDVSHRGGKPGFVRLNENELLVPDFSGNNLFNTLGNIALDPRVGLLFIDYVTGDLLHIAGEAGIVFDGAELQSFAGAQRLLRIQVSEACLRRQALGLRWSEAEQSPFLEATGEW